MNCEHCEIKAKEIKRSQVIHREKNRLLTEAKELLWWMLRRLNRYERGDSPESEKVSKLSVRINCIMMKCILMK
jgi:hypothetical protein